MRLYVMEGSEKMGILFIRQDDLYIRHGIQTKTGRKNNRANKQFFPRLLS